MIQTKLTRQSPNSALYCYDSKQFICGFMAISFFVSTPPPTGMIFCVFDDLHWYIGRCSFFVRNVFFLV
ncbi:hypothetical protein ACHAXS_013021 [Conticribra weissflogii]